MLWHTDPGTAQKRPSLLEIRSSSGLITLSVAAALFTDSFLYAVVVPVIPTALRQRVGLPQNEEQKWTSILLSLYAGSLLVASPFLGYFADRMQSRRLPLLLGLVALAASTGLLCIGTSLALWITGRICQGISAAVVWSVGYALMRETVDAKKFGQASGVLGMAGSLGSMSGPLLGGVLYQQGGYYAVFGLSFAVISVDIFLRFVIIEKRHAKQWLEPENPEISLAIHEANQAALSTGEPADIADIELSHETNTHTTSLPATKYGRWGSTVFLLRSRRLASVLAGYLIIALIGASFNTILPLFVNATFGWQQMGQGLIFITLSIPHFADPLVGRIIDWKRSLCRYIAGGALFSSVPIYALLRLVERDSLEQKILLCAFLTLIGLSLAVCLPPLMLEVSNVLGTMEEENPAIFGKGGAAAQAYGILNSAWAMGSLVGPYLAGYIRAAGGWGTVVWVLGLVVGITAIPVFLNLGGWIFEKRDGEREESREHAD